MNGSRVHRLVTAVLALGLLLAPTAAAIEDDPRGRHPCATATARCDGQLEVPLDWSNPGAGRISVAFAWLPRRDVERPATGTILANPGGPASVLAAVPVLEQVLGPVLDRQNLLVVEPRGLGGPSQLLCPGLDLRRPTTIQACATQLGSRIRFFTTDQAVVDMDAVRHALGVPAITFYGNSYGTLFAPPPHSLRLPTPPLAATRSPRPTPGCPPSRACAAANCASTTRPRPSTSTRSASSTT